MKRELVCSKCVDAWQRLIGKYPGEEVTIVRGTCIVPYVCDDCGKAIDAKHFAAAVSVSTPRTPYVAWESEFVKPFPPSFQSATGPMQRP